MKMRFSQVLGIGLSIMMEINLHLMFSPNSGVDLANPEHLWKSQTFSGKEHVHSLYLRLDSKVTIKKIKQNWLDFSKSLQTIRYRGCETL